MANKFTNPSGFQENLPNQQIVEDRLKAQMKKIYEAWGYTPIETPAVEYMDTLASKGDINTEIYAITRAAAEGESQESDRGLRYDLTVPFARFVAQHFNDLKFPFKRYQIQKVWRGERPQKGRFREFYQADIDVIAQENLPLHFDAEMIAVVSEILNSFEIGGFTIHLNNRKFLQGWLETLGVTIEQMPVAMRVIDKLDKIGAEKVAEALQKDLGMAVDKAKEFLKLLDQQIALNEAGEFFKKVTGESTLLAEGKEELLYIAAQLKDLKSKNGKVVFNPKIARGLDYYTGSVYETTIDGFEKYGSVCSGGRYANLAARFINRELPGVGISIGLTRLFEIIKSENLIEMKARTVTQVMIGLFSEEQRLKANEVAVVLREQGINTDVYYNAAQKIAKQFEFASKMGIQYVLLLEENGGYTLKRMEEGKQEILVTLEHVAGVILGVKLFET